MSWCFSRLLRCYSLSLTALWLWGFGVLVWANPPLQNQAQTQDQLTPHQLAAAAIERTHHSVCYDGRYLAIGYPGGDVPADMGVCTDVIIRSYRRWGIDLQQLVHEDMQQHFQAYPSQRIWGLSRPDSNIDHRRVPNLQTFFERHGQSLRVSDQASDYQPGDIVTWMLPGNLPHIGIVTDRRDPQTDQLLIAHNIGAGPQLEAMLFAYPITGHYRYFPATLP